MKRKLSIRYGIHTHSSCGPASSPRSESELMLFAGSTSVSTRTRPRQGDRALRAEVARPRRIRVVDVHRMDEPALRSDEPDQQLFADAELHCLCFGIGLAVDGEEVRL